MEFDKVVAMRADMVIDGADAEMNMHINGEYTSRTVEMVVYVIAKWATMTLEENGMSLTEAKALVRKSCSGGATDAKRPKT